MSDDSDEEELATLWISITKGFFAALGIFGNILVLRVLLQRHMLNTFNKLRCALAVFDALLLTNAHLESILRYSRNVYVIPNFFWPMANLTHTASTFMTMVIAVERFVAVNHPHQYRKNRPYGSTKYVCLVTIPAILLNITKWFELQPKSENPEGIQKFKFTNMYKSKVYIIYNSVILNLVVKGLIPITVLIYTYAKIYDKVKENHIVRVKSRTKPITNAKKHVISIIVEQKRTKRQEKMALTFAGVVITYLVCNIPHMCVQILVLASINSIMLSPDTLDDPPLTIRIGLHVRDLFIILNSVANILIYTWLDTNFRQEFRNVFEKAIRSYNPGGNHTPSNGIPKTAMEDEMRTKPTCVNLSSVATQTDPNLFWSGREGAIDGH